MKSFYLSFLLLLSTSLANAQFSADVSYNLGLPRGKMADNITAVHQFRLGGNYRLPSVFKMVNLGVELGLGNYANLRLPTTFNFGNGNPTTTFVNYSSNTFQANAVVNVDLVKDFVVTPFVTLKGGYQKWYSNITVEDPNDIDGCQPLDRKSILKDGTTTLGYGGGLRMELNGNKNKNKKMKGFAERHYIELGVTATRGGNIDYINTRKLKEHDHNATTPPVVGDEGKPVELRFINVQSNVIHNHMVAEMYTTPLRLFEVKLGYHVRF